ELDHHDLLEADLRAHDGESRATGERVLDQAVAHARGETSARRPRRTNRDLSVEDLRILEPDPRAEARHRIGGIRLRRRPEDPVVPILRVRQLLDDDVRAIDPEIAEQDPPREE